MDNNKNKSCLTCFYVDTNINKAPCNTCNPKLDKYVPMNSFIDDEAVISNKQDSINSPKHYNLFDGIEVRDVIEVLVGKMYSRGIPAIPLFVSDYVQMMQYLMRFMDKNGVEDLKKAQYYLTELIEAYE